MVGTDRAVAVQTDVAPAATAVSRLGGQVRTWAGLGLGPQVRPRCAARDHVAQRVRSLLATMAAACGPGACHRTMVRAYCVAGVARVATAELGRAGSMAGPVDQGSAGARLAERLLGLWAHEASRRGQAMPQGRLIAALVLAQQPVACAAAAWRAVMQRVERPGCQHVAWARPAAVGPADRWSSSASVVPAPAWLKWEWGEWRPAAGPGSELCLAIADGAVRRVDQTRCVPARYAAQQAAVRSALDAN